MSKTKPAHKPDPPLRRRVEGDNRCGLLAHNSRRLEGDLSPSAGHQLNGSPEEPLKVTINRFDAELL